MPVDPDVLRWVKTWQQAGPELEAIRREEVRRMDTRTVIAQLTDAFNHATSLPPRKESGLVEMQRIFAKLRAR